ncbi:hypothetical protein FOS14_20795 [Skermania sp. ID1734]|uniref:DUF5666 domain-containing protein n=1 Tax=Skermania sp. ID1734 TaxID=2597516 RepID=UPI00117DCF6F|nr:DUF5666 domain-containing protein [Skermania sp. ID1734]TSD94456.1 hypothetical protein FOS14_20795 [Skermania sp. ID1734]
MSNPDDPWRSQGSRDPAAHGGGDGWAAPGGEGWSAPSGDQPTDRYANPDQPTEHYGWGQAGYHTSNPYEAYGQVPPNATAPYPPAYNTNAYGQPNPTQAYPTYYQPPGGYPPGEIPPLETTGGPGGPRKPHRWIPILAVVGILALVGVIALAWNLSKSDDSSSDQAAVTPTHSLPIPQQTLPRTGGPLTTVQIPGLNGSNTTMGKVASNDGTTITLSDLSGDTVTIQTDDNTQVLGLTGTKVSDLKVGDTIIVQGDKVGNGTIHATSIVSMALPDFGGFGNPPR